MADEIQIAFQESGLTVYAAIRDAGGNVWDTTLNSGAGGFVTISSVDWPDAAVSMSEQGTTGDYYGDFPVSAQMSADTYILEIFEQTGTSPSRKDDCLVARAPMYWTESILTFLGVKAFVDWGLFEIGLHKLLADSVSGSDVANNSIIAKLASSAGTADWDTFDNTTDSLEALANA